MGQPFRINHRVFAFVLLWVTILSPHASAQQQISPGKKMSGDSPTSGEAPAAARGQIVFKERCAICHFNESDVQKIGPGLRGLFKRGKFAAGGKVDDVSVESLILNGGKDMPPFKPVLNPAQMRDLISYLKTL